MRKRFFFFFSFVRAKRGIMVPGVPSGADRENWGQESRRVTALCLNL